MCQFGIHGDPKVSAAWREAAITDEPVKAEQHARRDHICQGRAQTRRTTQLFINFGDNTPTRWHGFPLVWQGHEGMDVVDKINGEYGEGAPGGGPGQDRIQTEGNAYLKKDFPNLDYIKSATSFPTAGHNFPA